MREDIVDVRYFVIGYDFSKTLNTGTGYMGGTSRIVALIIFWSVKGAKTKSNEANNHDSLEW